MEKEIHIIIIYRVEEYKKVGLMDRDQGVMQYHLIFYLR
jgi:hypothetical protein